MKGWEVKDKTLIKRHHNRIDFIKALNVCDGEFLRIYKHCAIVWKRKEI